MIFFVKFACERNRKPTWTRPDVFYTHHIAMAWAMHFVGRGTFGSIYQRNFNMYIHCSVLSFHKELGWCFWHAAWMDMCSHVRTCFTHVIALAWAMHSLWKGDPISTYAGLSLGPESGLGCWAWCLDSPCARGKTARQQLLSYTQFWGLTHFSRSNASSGNAKHWHVDSNAFFHMQDRPVHADNWIRGGSPFFTERILL